MHRQSSGVSIGVVEPSRIGSVSHVLTPSTPGVFQAFTPTENRKRFLVSHTPAGSRTSLLHGPANRKGRQSSDAQGTRLRHRRRTETLTLARPASPQSLRVDPRNQSKASQRLPASENAPDRSLSFILPKKCKYHAFEQRPRIVLVLPDSF